MHKIIHLIMFIFLFSCGKGFQKESVINASEEPGNYIANLISINKNLGIYEGWARFTILDDQFWARLKISGPPDLQTVHPQYVTNGGRCPTLADDLNRDGIIDIIETIKVTGPLLFPLDANLNTRIRGIDNFLRIKKQGFYFYSKSSSMRRMLQDLRRPSFMPRNIMVNLKEGEDLYLYKRVVLILGISEDLKIPKSAATIPGLPLHYTLPVSCGLIEHYFAGTEIAD